MLKPSATTQAQPGSFTAVNIALTFGAMGYMGSPYFPELDMTINVMKEVHPKLKGAKRQQAIEAELTKRNLTQADFDLLLLRSQRKFYTASDADDGSGEIVIPRHTVTAMLVQTVKRAPKNAVPQVNIGLIHAAFQMREGWLRTGKTKNDAKFYNRFVKNSESNQRRWDSTPFIPDFQATGVALIEESLVAVADFQNIFEFAGRYIGIGCCRDQGYGRFFTTVFDRLDNEK